MTELTTRLSCAIFGHDRYYAKGAVGSWAHPSDRRRAYNELLARRKEYPYLSYGYIAAMYGVASLGQV